MSTSSKLLLWSSADEDDDEDDPADDDGDLESVYDIAHSLDQSPTHQLLPRRRLCKSRHRRPKVVCTLSIEQPNV